MSVISLARLEEAQEGSGIARLVRIVAGDTPCERENSVGELARLASWGEQASPAALEQRQRRGLRVLVVWAVHLVALRRPAVPWIVVVAVLECVVRGAHFFISGFRDVVVLAHFTRISSFQIVV